MPQYLIPTPTSFVKSGKICIAQPQANVPHHKLRAVSTVQKPQLGVKIFLFDHRAAFVLSRFPIQPRLGACNINKQQKQKS